MGTEVEHKFLVADDSWRGAVTGSTEIIQGYLARAGQVTVRVRLTGTRAFLTVKGPTRGTSRAEFEYEVPADDAREMLAELADGPVIHKVRHLVPVGEHVWEVDVFAGENAPLVLAEVELGAPDEPFDVPGWAGADVSDDPRYFNANLALEPYSRWGSAG
jgi:adenylate cyclase